MTEEARNDILAGLPEEAALLLVLERLKDEVRNNPLAHNPRKERVAEHSWFVAVSVPLLAEFSTEPIDIAKATLLATVHDLAEAYVGDTFAFGPEVAGQHARERAAMERLRESSVSPAIQRIVALWFEYEDQATPEARFVKGMDTFLPILLNFSNVKCSSWAEHGVRSDQVRKRVNRVRDSIGSLAEINDNMIDQAQEDGYLA